jgi:hypothetical protein
VSFPILYQMDQLQRLYNNNPGIGAIQLYTKALKEGLQVNKRVVDDLIARKGEAQIFQQRKPSQGTTAPMDESIGMMDLIDYKASPSGRFTNILLLVRVFTRQVYMKSITNKKPATVERALKEILDRAGEPSFKQISSDQGGEFLNGPVSRLLEQRGIAHRLKRVGDMDALAVLDRTMQNLKLRLSKVLTARNKKNWDTEIKNVETSYNTNRHRHLMGEEPNSVPDVVKFKLFQESAEAIENNHERNKKQTEALEATQKFRAPLRQKDFERGFKPRFGQIRTVRSTEGGVVTDTKGDTHLIKQVQIVKPDSTDPKPPDFGSKATSLKPGLKIFADALKTYVKKNGPTALTIVGRHLNKEDGFQEARGNLTILQFVKLFPTMFKITGSRQQTKVDLK